MSEIKLGPWTWRKDGPDWIGEDAERDSELPFDIHHTSPLGLALDEIERLRRRCAKPIGHKSPCNAEATGGRARCVFVLDEEADGGE